ncbi:MAG: hypothetical protein ABEK42_00895 [Thiohalorhabdaceae bacterium]
MVAHNHHRALERAPIVGDGPAPRGEGAHGSGSVPCSDLKGFRGALMKRPEEGELFQSERGMAVLVEKA